MFGTAGLPHILMRFFTVPTAQQARKSVVWAMAIIGGFYVLTPLLGFGAPRDAMGCAAATCRRVAAPPRCRPGPPRAMTERDARGTSAKCASRRGVRVGTCLAFGAPSPPAAPDPMNAVPDRTLPARRSVRRVVTAPPLAVQRLPQVPRTKLVEAAARVIARRGHRGLLWSHVAREAGTRSLVVQRRFEDIDQLVYECHVGSAALVEASLLRAETAAGPARDRLGAFLVTALRLKRERGSLLPLRGVPALPTTSAKRLREREQMIRVRLERLLRKGERDGSLATPDREAAIELVLATLHHHSGARDTHDPALVRLVLVALAPR